MVFKVSNKQDRASIEDKAGHLTLTLVIEKEKSIAGFGLCGVLCSSIESPRWEYYLVLWLSKSLG